MHWRRSLYYEIAMNPFSVYPISLVVRSEPFLDLTYPNMQIEKRSRATSKIPGGEWTIQLARTGRGI